MRTVILFLTLLIGISAYAQPSAQADTTFRYPTKEALGRPYNPKEDAHQKIAELIRLAKKEHKNIFIQAGGNWCGWCLRFNYFVHNVPELNNILNKNYLYYHLNFSPENKNEKVFRKYTDPKKRYGYPFFIILSDAGKLLHVQESGIFEADKGYDVKKVRTFLEKWSPK